MDQKEHLQRSKDEIQAIISVEKVRHKMSLEAENKFHALRIEELERVIIRLDNQYPDFSQKDNQ